MQASGARGSIGKASYEAVRKHIDAGKKATEAFKLVAQETGRSTATVQTAYYRVARSLPGGGGVQLRPRGAASTSKAEPMSMILALPVRLSMMFEGLMSPCTMPSRCSAANAARHSRNLRANSTASGVSPCTQIVSA